MTPKWAWPGSSENFETLRPPYNFGTNRDICFKFGIDIDDGSILRLDHKMTPNWAWSRDQISKFSDPLIKFERIELSASIWYIHRRRTPACEP